MPVSSNIWGKQCGVTGPAEAGGPGGARAPPPPPTFWHREKKKRKKKGEGGERRGKRVFIQSPTEIYTCAHQTVLKCIKPQSFRGLRPLDPIRYELGCASAPSQLIFPLSNLVPPPPPTGVLVGWGGGARPPK